VKDNGLIFYKRIKITKSIENLVKNHFLLIYTQQKRLSSNVIQSQKKNKDLIKIYDIIKSLNTKFINAFKNNQINVIANIFNIHWNLKKKLSKII
jgi:galactokinase/mevalonate kinase-like predicted kinase